ncbi:MAG TPA: hypothetical protein VGL69_05215 [Solirubrobacteraceae bacterium]|jgi:hypothetical protein
MPPLPFADNFLAGSLLTILLPLGLLIALVIWYLMAVRRVPADTPVSSPSLPRDEVVDAAGPAVVSDVTLEADVTPIDNPVDEV